jgi:hypothetical protein
MSSSSTQSVKTVKVEISNIVEAEAGIGQIKLQDIKAKDVKPETPQEPAEDVKPKKPSFDSIGNAEFGGKVDRRSDLSDRPRRKGGSPGLTDIAKTPMTRFSNV